MTVPVKSFISEIFLGQTDRVWVCSAHSETHTGAYHNFEWKGGRPDEVMLLEDAGAYYSLGLIKPGATRKALSTWDGGTMMVLDDVGEKSVHPDVILNSLGAPTFVVQTSLNSQQWGYVFTYEVKDINLIARLQKACTSAFYPNGGDPGHEPPVQYLRLPFGVNDKDKHTQKGAVSPPAVTLVAWAPERKYEPMDLAMGLGSNWTQTAGFTVSTSVAAGSLTIQQITEYKKTDPVLAGLDSLGMVKGPQGQGWIEITCPWAGTHTNHDDRTGYNPARREFKCYHSDGVAPGAPAKNYADVRAWLVGQLGQTAWDATVTVCAGSAFGAPLAEPAAAPAKRTGRRSLVSGGQLEARRTVVTHLARGEVTHRVGMPGGGKSALALAYGAAISTDRPALIGENTIERPGRVIILSNEDSPMDYEKRLYGWLDFHGKPALLQPFEAEGGCTAVQGSVTDRNAPPELHKDMIQLAEDIKRDREAGIDTCLVILDTQASMFVGVPENDNSAMGTAFSKLAEWARSTDVAVEVIHHSTKSSWAEGASGAGAGRGAGAQGGSARNVVIVAPCTPAQMLMSTDAVNWVREIGAKSNHGSLMSERWWRKELRPVPVWDRGVQVKDQIVPVYVYHAKQPAWLAAPLGVEAVGAVVRGVADMERAKTWLRVNKGGGQDAGWSQLASANSWADDDAKTSVSEARKQGLIVQGQERLGKGSGVNLTAVWKITAKGQAFLEALAKTAFDAVNEAA